MYRTRVTPAEIYATARPDRFARTIRTDSPEGCKIALLGLPDDTGVALNGGRVGAREGPRAFREALARYGTTWYQSRTPNEPHEISDEVWEQGEAVGDSREEIETTRREKSDAPRDLSEVGVFDAGDVEAAPGGSVAAMQETHDRVTARVRRLLGLNLLPVCIGGGHDLTWPAIRAVAAKFPGLAGVYYDAHLDVREEPGSGMAFRKILTETTCRRLYVEGLDAFANSREHIQWFEAHGGKRVDFFDRRIHETEDARIFGSFDLDVLNVSHAPGVSAINPVGIEAFEAVDAAWQFGRDRRVVSFDIMELNPKYDIDGRTARLAARLFLSFVAGYALRKK